MKPLTMNTARFIAMTVPRPDLIENERLTAEGFIEYMARVSAPSNVAASLNPGKLLRFLVEKGHWSPFDMVTLTVEVATSRAIMAQVLRHWSFRFQEFSQRYATVNALDFSTVEGRVKHEGGNRQGSAETDEELTAQLQDACHVAAGAYEHAIACGCAPESARMALPLATPTRAFVTGSVRSWLTYFWQRLDPHAQAEHRELATSIFVAVFAPRFPLLAELVVNYKPQVSALPGWAGLHATDLPKPFNDAQR